MNRDFSQWLKTFRQSINGYTYYIDFAKVYGNVEKLKVEINILNSLICSKDIEHDFDNLIAKYPDCLKAIPILLAVRENESTAKTKMVQLITSFLKKCNPQSSTSTSCEKPDFSICFKSISSAIYTIM